jgi:hypothetical protein
LAPRSSRTHAPELQRYLNEAPAARESAVCRPVAGAMTDPSTGEIID